MRYEKIVFYGDSFTWGADSGGDDIHDDNKTYPAFFGKIVGKPIVNNAEEGLSNLGMLYKMLDYTNHCLENERSNTLENTLNIVNLSSVLRGTVTSIVSEESAKYPYSAKLFSDTPTRFDIFGPGYEKPLSQQTNYSMKVYYNETDIRICLDQYMILLAMKDLANRLNMGIIFVDVIFGLSDLELMNNFNFSKMGIHIIDFKHHNYHRGSHAIACMEGIRESKSRHYYEDGYEFMANMIHNRLKEKASHIFDD